MYRHSYESEVTTMGLFKKKDDKKKKKKLADDDDEGCEFC